MNFKIFGLIVGAIGILCLMMAMIFGIMIGFNERTMTEYWNSDGDVEEDDYDKASEWNAFLNPVGQGMAGFGMGFLFIGIGLTLAGDNKGNMLVLIIAILAVLILIAGAIISLYIGISNRTSTKIGHEDDPSEDDIEKRNNIEKRNSFLQPFNWFFSEFLFGSCGMGLALATILAGAFIMAGSKKKKEQMKKESTYSSDDEDMDEDEDVDFD